jgi:hypothetical protein
MENHGGMILTGENRVTMRNTCPSATSSITNPTWTEPGVRAERPVTTRLSHGTAIEWIKLKGSKGKARP